MSSIPPYDCIIVGGGVAGLSAAVALSARGKRILLLEERQHLGGRTFSYADPKTGDTLDNGQHLLMGCYVETRKYLRTIGAEHLAELQDHLRIEFLHPTRGRAVLTTNGLPAPFHALGGMLGLQTLPLSDRLRLARVGLELLIPESIQAQRLANRTVSEWLKAMGQSDLARAYLWDVIAIGSLNDTPDVVSALLFYRVLKTAFFGSRTNASLLVPRVGLTELFVTPAETFIRNHGGEIRTGSAVTGIHSDQNGSVRVEVTGRRPIRAKSAIAAVPWYADEEVKGDGAANPSKSFSSSPIISIYVWLDRVVTGIDFAATIGTRIQWIFNRNALLQGVAGKKPGQCLCFVISGAGAYVDKSRTELTAIAMEDLRVLIPEARTARVQHSVVIKEKRATFSPTPAMEPFRPSTRTTASNIFRAGDWTNTGFPATIEGAILSGHRAADCVLARSGNP